MTHNTPAPAPASHTPGPWHKHAEYIYAGTMQGELIAQVYDCASINREFAESAKAIDLDSSQANARLIASAPEMYSELERLDQQIEALGNDENIPCTSETWELLMQWQYSIRAVLAKAKGQRS